MNIKEKKEQFKTWIKDNKRFINVGLGLVSFVAVTVVTSIILSKPKTDNNTTDELYLESDEEVKPEKQIIINFTDEETGDVLWKERCGEEYMNDMKDCGMQYEEVRKLNGIEEA